MRVMDWAIQTRKEQVPTAATAPVESLPSHIKSTKEYAICTKAVPIRGNAIFNSAEKISPFNKLTSLIYQQSPWSVIIIGPSFVMASWCSYWAESEPSAVLAVQPLSSIVSSFLPMLIIGSIVNTMPS